MDQSRAASTIDAFRRRSVVVLGDYYLDEYQHCAIRGISPEMPVLRMLAERREHAPGAAGNLAANLSRLGAKVRAVGAVGEDQAGERLKELLEDCGVDTGGLAAARERSTGVLSRILAARGDGQGHYHHLRVDYEPSCALSQELAGHVLERLGRSMKGAEALYLADYDENRPPIGALARPIAVSAIAAAREARVPVYASSRLHPADFAGADCLICNEREAALLGYAAGSAAGLVQDIRDRMGLGVLCITRGEAGVICASDSGMLERAAHASPAGPAAKDACGAGDTFGATLMLATLSGADLETALELAGVAAALAVRKAQTGAVSGAEILREIRYPGVRNEKLVSEEELAGLLDDLRPTKKIVFTNGCFDLFHSGHVHLLRSARAFGDVLVVAVNSDRSTAENKGAGRPVLSERHRVEILAALDFVDYVTVFDQLTPISIIRRLRPHVLVKGGDYTADQVVGKDIVTAYGGEVRIVKHEGHSTTSLIRFIKEASDGTRPA
jgi:D-beta-D-heptose 7-phosphate kinase/D-beta-D-heptose 1-phosphate adenosyltransferase